MTLTNLFRALRMLVKFAIALSLVLMVGLVFTNVVLRYLFDSGLTWSSEVARYLFVWVIFLGSILAVADHSHLGVDLLAKRMPLTVQKIFFVVSVILVVGIMTLLVKGLLVLIELNIGMTGPATEIPINNYYYAGMISAILMSIVLVYQAITFVFLNKNGPDWTRHHESEV